MSPSDEPRPDATSVLLPGPWTHRDLSANGVRLHVAEAGEGPLVLLAGIAALVGRSSLKKIEKPERTLESLRDLPEVIHREAPGQRRREVPTVSNGRVQLRGSENYTV